MARILRVTKSDPFMSSSNNDQIGFQRQVLLEKFGPQFVLLLFPALCAFVIIFTGEGLIVSDLAFIFGAILVIEAAYFTYWGYNTENNMSNDPIDSFPEDVRGIEFRLECPKCNKSFYALVNKNLGDIECTHCQFSTEIEDLESILENC